MSNKPRQRLDVEARRSQLLAVGSELFAARPYDDVWIDDVAERAGVSRGLLYHYFGNKRGFLHAVIERETQHILAATAPDPALPGDQQLRASIEGYLDYVVARPHGYRAIFRGAVSSDAQVREIVDANLRRQEERILVAVTAGAPAGPLLRLAVRGWLAFLVSVVLDWLDDPTAERSTVAEFAVRSLGALVEASNASPSSTNVPTRDQTVPGAEE